MDAVITVLKTGIDNAVALAVCPQDGKCLVRREGKEHQIGISSLPRGSCLPMIEKAGGVSPCQKTDPKTLRKAWKS